LLLDALMVEEAAS